MMFNWKRGLETAMKETEKRARQNEAAKNERAP